MPGGGGGNLSAKSNPLKLIVLKVRRMNLLSFWMKSLIVHENIVKDFGSLVRGFWLDRWLNTKGFKGLSVNISRYCIGQTGKSNPKVKILQFSILENSMVSIIWFFDYKLKNRKACPSFNAAAVSSDMGIKWEIRFQNRRGVFLTWDSLIFEHNVKLCRKIPQYSWVTPVEVPAWSKLLKFIPRSIYIKISTNS